MSSLVSSWREVWAERSESSALLAPAEGVSWTFGELDERSALAARRIASVVAPGERVVLSCAPSAATVVSYIGILRAGATVVPANTAYTAHELRHIVDVAEPTLAILDDPSRVSCRSVGVDLAGLDVGDEPAASGTIAMLGFTSGTTGQPKAAALSHDALLAGAGAVVEAWEWSSQDHLLHVLPMFHMHGLGVGLNGALLAGSTLTVLPRFDPAVVAEQRATMFFGVPTMYARLARARALQHMRTYRLLVSGSAPLAPDLFAAVANDAGQAPLERYGMTETVMITGNPLHGERRPGSVGVPMPGMSVRLGENDVVEVRGTSVFEGYLGVSPAETFTRDGWFPTGDIGRWDTDGYLSLVGRASELIITGGYNVYPREVEDVIRTVPGVVDVAVIGRADPEWGEVVTAVVVGDVDATTLEGAARSALASFKCPRAWEFRDELPRNAMGKLIRSALR